jgi:hypothetical protein
VQGALTCRAGVLARDAGQLPEVLREFYPRFALNYFEVISAWYEAVRVGAPCGSISRKVERLRDKKLFRFAVNPGHYLHLDEWLHSPFTAQSEVRLQSGMMLQMDIIPVSNGPFCYVNAEDGIALADETLRAQLAAQFPQMWRRICARQQFMREVLGVDIDDSVLPLSNTPGWLPPYALDLDRVFAWS